MNLIRSPSLGIRAAIVVESKKEKHSSSIASSEKTETDNFTSVIIHKESIVELKEELTFVSTWTLFFHLLLLNRLVVFSIFAIAPVK